MLGTNHPLSTAATSRARSPTSAHLCWVPHARTPRQDTLPPPSPHHCAQHTLGAAGAPGARTQPAPPPPRPCPGHGAAAGWAAGRLPAPLTSPAPWDRGWRPAPPGQKELPQAAAPTNAPRARKVALPHAEQARWGRAPGAAAGAGSVPEALTTRPRTAAAAPAPAEEGRAALPELRSPPGAPRCLPEVAAPASRETDGGWKRPLPTAAGGAFPSPQPRRSPAPPRDEGEAGRTPGSSVPAVSSAGPKTPRPPPSRAVRYLQRLQPAPPGSGGGRDRAGAVPPS